MKIIPIFYKCPNKNNLQIYNALGRRRIYQTLGKLISGELTLSKALLVSLLRPAFGKYARFITAVRALSDVADSIRLNSSVKTLCVGWKIEI